MWVMLVRWTCSRSPILPSGSEPRAAEDEHHQRLVAREREPERPQHLAEPREQDLLHAHDRRDRRHRRRGLLAPALAPLAARLRDRVERKRLAHRARKALQTAPGRCRVRAPDADGRCWVRTSDPFLVREVLYQLS